MCEFADCCPDSCHTQPEASLARILSRSILILFWYFFMDDDVNADRLPWRESARVGLYYEPIGG